MYNTPTDVSVAYIIPDKGACFQLMREQHQLSSHVGFDMIH